MCSKLNTNRKLFFEPSPIILGTPGRVPLCELNGIDDTSVQITKRTNNTHKLTFSIDKYVNGELSNGYKWIEEQMELYCDGIWFTISEPPSVEYDSFQEIKTVTAESEEIRLTQYMLNSFAINQGSEYSYEMMYRDNHPTEDKDGNVLYYQVKFYNKTEPMLSLLDLVLYHAEVPDWKIGYIDDITVNPADNTTLLPDEVMNFDVEEKSVYAFLTQDVASTCRCVFEFDTKNMLINAYRPESLGKDTNVIVDFHNVQNSISIRRENPLVTVLNVSGDEGVTIDYVNPCGGSIIEDLTAFAKYPYMNATLTEKYLAWISLRDSYVEPYMQLSREYHSNLEIISEYYNRVPSDTVQNDYYSMSIENLQIAYNSAIAIVTALENKFKNENGDLDIDALKESVDWELYSNTRNYVIPTVVAAIQGKDGEVPDSSDYGSGNLLKNSVPISLGNNSWVILGSGEYNCESIDDQPDYGMTSGLRITPVDTSGVEQTSIQTTVNMTYCLSVYVKATTDMTVNLQFGVALDRDARETKSFSVTSGTWQRLHAVFDAENKLSDVAFTCIGEGSVIFTGMQLELGASPTLFSYYKIDDSELKSYETNWNLYGIDELSAKLEVYQNSIDILTENGYNEPYSSLTNKDEPYHIKMHQQYLDYVNLRDGCSVALEERIQQVLPYETRRDELSQQRSEINTLLQKENFGITQNKYDGFTDLELTHLKRLRNQQSYSNPNIIVTSLDSLQDEVDIQKKLYDDAMDELYVESHLQYTYTDSIDNILALPEFTVFEGDLDINNFIRVGIDDEETYVKLRVTEITYNPRTNENDMEITFSNMVQYRSKRDDLAIIIAETENKSSKGQIVGSGTDDVTSFFFTPEIISQLVSNPNFQSSLGGLTVGGSGYAGYAGTSGESGSTVITPDSVITALVSATEGQFETITAETGFYKYLDTNLLSADRVATKLLDADEANIKELSSTLVTAEAVNAQLINADQASIDSLSSKIITADNATLTNLISSQITTSTLSADFANIKNLLAGNAGVGDLQAINLTSANVTIADAVIKDLIAAKISVADLQAGNIVLSDNMQILSENGKMIMNGTALQILGTDSEGNEYVGIQLGYDTTNNPSLILRNEDGATILTPEGITENAIADKLINNTMLGDGSVSKRNLDWTDISESVDENGNPIWDIANISINGNKFGVEYTTFKETTTNSLNTLSNMVQSVELLGQQVFTETEGVISPTVITIRAIVKNGAVISKWYIDGVENTEYVANDKTSISIPSSFMVDKKSIVVKVECEDATKYDVMTLYRVVDGSDSYTVTISSSQGTTFKTVSEETFSMTTTCTCTVYKGATETEAKSYTWLYIENDGTTWRTLGTGKTIDFPISGSIIRKRLKCRVEI